MFEDEYKTSPDEKHWVIDHKITGERRILPEAQLKNTFGTERWLHITSGRDRYFDAFPYIPE